MAFFDNPYVAGGAGLIGALGNALYESPEDKLIKTQMGRGNWLFDFLKAHQGSQFAPQINAGQSAANTRQQLAPTLNNLTWQASRHSGISSPEAWGQIQQNYLPLEAGRANQVQDQNAQMKQQYQQLILSLLGGLSR